jgi:hypothetical protein
VSSEPIRQPANDLIAFDISKQSPEQIAHLFARWKEQRKRLQAPGPRRRPPHLKPVPPITQGVVEETEEAALVADTEPGGAVRYSASFEALLSAREPTLAQRVWNPDAGLAKLGRPRAPRRRSRTKWLLAGAASVVAVAAMAGDVLWERSAARLGWTQAGDKPDNALVGSPVEAAVTPTYPMDIPMAEPFLAKATASRQADWPMRQAVDLALMKTAPVAEAAHLPLMPQLKPPVPVVRTASKPAAKPAAAVQSETEPSEAPVARVELPLVPSVTTATVSVPVAPATETRNDDSRSNVITGRGNDKDNFTFGTNSRMASSGSKPAGASGTGGSADPGSGSAGGNTGGSGDPGNSGGTGGDPDGGTGGSDPGGGNTGGGDAGGGDTGGGDTGGGNTGGGDPGGGDAGGGGSGGGDSGGGDSGGDGDTGGGDSGGGDSDSGDGDSGGEGGDSGEGGESGESGGGDDGDGIGGAIGGALGGIGDALGGALGGGKGDADGDKDKDKDD